MENDHESRNHDENKTPEKDEQSEEEENLAQKKYYKEVVVKDDDELKEESMNLIKKIKMQAVQNLAKKSAEKESQSLSQSGKKL